ncbi:MAG: carboxyltransferase domain-containing protein [Acidobacteria bacterium]|nr:carboxyltransferase domain-containing protein [Acidobacteriota bacterium]
MSFESIGFDDLHALAEAARALDGVVAAIPGHASVLVLARDSALTGAIEAAIKGVIDRGLTARSLTELERHELEVDFADEHAPDMQLLLARAGLSKADLLARIASLELRARYLGFLPGFAYLEGWPEDWSLPRRATVRERVPAGSFGIAGAMAGFYPGESPGGWNIIGRTSATLWDPSGVRPNTIAAGDFVTIRAGRFIAAQDAAPTPAFGAEALAEVVAPGVATIVAGEPDMERYEHGIAPGGVFDEAALRLANWLVGNGNGAMALECAALGPRLRFHVPCTIAIAGAEVDATVDGARVPMRARIEVATGTMLEAGPVRGGMRAVIAFRGGLVAGEPRWSPRPARLARGDRIFGAGVEARTLPLIPPPSGDRFAITAHAGPHDLDVALLEHITSRAWKVTPSLDRTGIRLAAGAPPAEIPALLPSCGMRAGSVQWHPGGELVVMGPDHPITGGYLQPLTVPGRELWKVAQLAPGDEVRFVLETQPLARPTYPCATTLRTRGS